MEDLGDREPGSVKCGVFKMMGFGMGFGILGLLFMFLFWAGLIFLAVWLVKAIFPSSSQNERRPPTPGHHPTAKEILNQRYARGEITREEYEIMRKDIER